MKKDIENQPQDSKPDLKHDTMEYAASTDGDDVLDMDTENADEIEQEEISVDELEILEEDDVDAQAAALDAVETDRIADNDLNFDEDEVNNEDEPYGDEADEEEMPRK